MRKKKEKEIYDLDYPLIKTRQLAKNGGVWLEIVYGGGGEEGRLMMYRREPGKFSDIPS